MGQSVSRAVEGSVLGEAAANNEIEVISQIVDTYPRALLYKTLFKRRTPLMLAAEHGAVESLLKLLWAAERLLVGAGYQQYLDERDGKGYTALSLAVKRGHSVCARLLLEDSADPLPANTRGDTALHLAAGGGHAACVDMLLRAWVRNRGSGTTTRAADAMVSDGVGEERYVDTHNRSGLAPLHLAVLGGSVEAAAVLIRGGASPDVPVLRGLQLRMPFLCGGSTPLHIAAFQGNARMCLVLLEGQWRHPGVELRRLRNARGLTPLNCALLAGHHDLARLLVESRLPSPVLSISRRALDYQFPEPLRQHLLGILHRAGLLVQLREISKLWKAQGLAKPTDDSVKMVGLAELRPGALTRLTQLVQREGSSLRDIIAGLEEAFAPAQQAQRQRGGALELQGQQPVQLSAAAAAGAARGPASSPAAASSAAEAAEAAAGARASVASLAASVSSVAAAASVAGATAGSVSSSRAVAGVEGLSGATASEGSSDGDGGSSRGGGRRRRGLGRSARRRGSRRTDPAVDSAAGPSGRSAGTGAGAGAGTSRDVDWTILEAQRMLSLDPWGMALSRRRTRGRRSGRRGAAEGGDSLPQTVLEVQQSGAGVMPPHRRRQRSRESRQLVLSELIESLDSVEGVLSSSAGPAAEHAASPPAGSSSPREHAGPSTQQAEQAQQGEQAQHRPLQGGTHGASGATISSGTGGSRSSAGGSNGYVSEGPGSTGEQEHQAPAAGRAADSQGPGECAICFDSTCDVMVGGCGHGICFVCACKMVARSNEPCCPFCRGPIHEFKQLTGARRRGDAAAA